MKKNIVDINKIVLDPNRGQCFLSVAISKLVSTDVPILLDGHFCLINENDIFKVPESIFTSIGLTAVFLIIEDPIVIYQRLIERGDTAVNLKVIENLQEEERLQAEIITSRLAIPLIVSENGDLKNLESYLNKHLLR